MARGWLDFLQRALLQRAGFTPHTLQVGGCELEYWEREPGRRTKNRPPLLLLHGLGARSSVWIPPARYLRRTGTVWAVDLPGHGGSRRLPGTPPLTPRHQADLIAGFLEAKGSRPAVVAGHSLGGWIATWMAVDHPQWVAALALLAPAGADGPGFRELRSFFLSFNRAADVDRLWERAFVRRPWWLRLLNEPTWHVLQRDDARAIVENTTEEELLGPGLASVKVPVFIAWGERERLIDPACFEALCSQLPRARRQVWEGAGHALPLEVPVRVAELLLQAVTAAEGTLSPEVEPGKGRTGRGR